MPGGGGGGGGAPGTPGRGGGGGGAPAAPGSGGGGGIGWRERERERERDCLVRGRQNQIRSTHSDCRALLGAADLSLFGRLLHV